MKIVVAGASGFIGRNLVPELLEDHYIKTLGRSEYQGEADQKIKADLRNPGEYRDALQDVETAYYLAHSMKGNPDFLEREVEAAESFVKTCEEEEVDHIIYLSGIAPSGKLSPHLESRRRVGEVLGSREPDKTELRASIVVGWESVSFQLMYQLVKNLPVVPFPESMNSVSQPIALEDTIYYLLHVLEDPEARGGTYDIGGGEKLFYREMMEVLADELGLERRFFTAPDLPVRFYSFWTRFFTDIDPELAHSLMGSLRHNLVVENGLETGREPENFRESVKKALEDR